MKNKPNKLINEQSPYLLQHAHNPVDWYPWCEEALSKSIKEDKLIFLSIGYSTCHWCHEMAHDAFSNIEIAAYLNENFVSIKVDREERPDIDEAYMISCQLLSENCGWPLNIVMTPDKKPVFAATFLPSVESYGRRSFLSILQEIQAMWLNERDKVVSVGNIILTRLETIQNEVVNEEINKDTLEVAFNIFSKSFDKIYGGFGLAPKFPTPHNLLFLLGWYKKTQDPYALEMVEKTLISMARGGIFDHLGGGFHRYSTDAKWMIPHFEKTLYDQALIVKAYIQAYLITNNEIYAIVAKKTLDFVLNEMTDLTGGFYAGLDSDTEGEEGKFYVWTKHEISTLLGADAEIFCKFYNITEIGNLESGNNVLFSTNSINELAREYGISIDEIKDKLNSCLKKVSDARAKRPRPAVDDKIIVSWNGLMINSFAFASKIFNDDKYKEAAIKAANFIMDNLIDADSAISRTYRKEKSNITGFLDDYAFLIYGLLELHNLTSENKYFNLSKKLADKIILEFFDTNIGGFFFTSVDSEVPTIRIKYIADQALPSGNSISAIAFLTIGNITGDEKYTNIAKSILSCFGHYINQSPINYSQFLIAFMQVV